jgi:hydroxymethylpyrimidine pyrophosphatase-like HAD family hydrolase
MIRQFYLVDEVGNTYFFDHRNKSLISDITNLGFSKTNTYLKYDDEYSLVKIKPYNGRRTEAIKHLSRYDRCDFKVIFISNEADLALAKMADFKICLASATSEVREACDYVVSSDDFNDVLRIFDRIYYKKNVKKYLESLK